MVLLILFICCIKMVCDMSKYIFYIPCFKYVDWQFLSNSYEECIDTMAGKLATIGINGFYTIDAVGCYKMRTYDEKLLVVFSDNKKVVKLFK